MGRRSGRTTGAVTQIARQFGRNVRNHSSAPYDDGMPIVLDDSAWPVLFHTMGAHTVEHFDHFAAWYLACLQRAQQTGSQIVLVTDVRGTATSTELRRYASRWMSQLSHQQREQCVLSVIILDNPMVRAGITALNWFQRPIAPQHVVADPGAAWAHVEHTLRHHHLPVPMLPAWLPA